MKGLTLTTKEQTRIQVLNGVIEGKVTVAEASGLMGVSERHAWRLLAAYRGEGPAAVAHEQGQEARDHHVPADTREGAGSWLRAPTQDSTTPI